MEEEKFKLLIIKIELEVSVFLILKRIHYKFYN